MDSLSFLFLGINFGALLPNPFAKLFSQFYLANQYSGSIGYNALFVSYTFCICLSQTESLEFIGYREELNKLDSYITAYILSGMIDKDFIFHYYNLIQQSLFKQKEE